MKKVLAVEYPIITSYTHHAHLLTILGTNEKTKDWIFSNYIQVYINKDFEKVIGPTSIFRCPMK